MSKLFKKTLFIIIMMFAIITVIVGLFVSWTLRETLTNEYLTKGIAISKSISSSSEQIIFENPYEIIQGVIDQFIAIEGVAYVFVDDENNEIIAHTFVPTIPTELQKLTTILESHEEGIHQSILTIKGHSYINIASPILGGVGGHVHVGMDQGLVNSQVESNIIKILMTMAAIFLFSIGLAFVFMNKISKPLSKLTQYAQRMTLMDFSTTDESMIEAQGNDEITDLTGTFNIMAERIRDYTYNLEMMVESRTKELQDRNKKIMESINYAKTLQLSILPKKSYLKDSFKDHFVIWKPKDVVGGDFYFYKDFGHSFLIAIIDCTGHGVPGAFMTMTANSLLTGISDIYGSNPAKVLQELNIAIRSALNQDSSDNLSDDGMDMAICHCIPGTKQIIYAGAKIPLYLCNGVEVITFKADRQNIGYKKSKEDFVYTNHEITLKEGESLYMTSDGILDQPDPIKRIPFGRTRFQNMILDLHNNPLHKQKQLIEETLKQHQANETQRDDITVIGFKI